MRSDLGITDLAVVAESGLGRDDPKLFVSVLSTDELKHLASVSFTAVLNRSIELDDDCVAVLIFHDLGCADFVASLIEQPTVEDSVLVSFGSGVEGNSHCGWFPLILI